MKKYRNKLTLILLIIIFSIFFTNSVFAKWSFEGNTGLSTTASGTGHGTSPALQKTPPEIVGSAIKIFITLLGILFLFLMLYGGYLWMTAQGNEEQVKKARNLITGAIIGLIIVSSAYIITAFIGGSINPLVVPEK